MEETNFYKQHTLPHIPQKNIDLSIPSMIGPYPIEGVLSTGGSSVVYLGKHPEKKIPLAIKTLAEGYLVQESMKARFLRESEIIGLTDHPNIIRLYGQGQWDRGLYIATEFVQGISLRRYMKEQPLTLEFAIDIILQVAYALLHLHTHGVIHRDVKPENILITEDGKVKLVDFGIALLTGETPVKEGSLMGTPSYMSPEQKKNPLSVNVQTDIYALGIVAYELLVGRLSFGNVQLERLPPHIRPIISKAIAPATQQRYQDIVDLISDLTKYVKSRELQQDKAAASESKESAQSIEECLHHLLPRPLLKSSDVDFHFEATTSILHPSSFHFIQTFTNHSVLALVIKLANTPTIALSQAALIKGLFTALSERSSIESLSEFASTLNRIYIQSRSFEPISGSLVLVEPLDDVFTFIPFGTMACLHNRFGTSLSRVLKAENPLLGEKEGIDFTFISDSLLKGDSVVLTTLAFDTTLIHSFVDQIADYTSLPLRKFLNSAIKKLPQDDTLSHEALLGLQRIT